MLRNGLITKLSTCSVLLAAFCVTATAHAETLRCGNQVVHPGQSRMEVRAKCGAPNDIVETTLVRTVATGAPDYRRGFYSAEETIVIPVETWTYNFGPHRFMCRLRFVSGMLEALETLGYGFDDDSVKK